jgi:hypothetical protein
MPFYGKYPFNPIDSGALWKKDAKGQGFGSTYGGNQISDITKSLNIKTVNEDRGSEMF